MKNWVKVLLVVVGAYVIIGAVVGNLMKGEESAVEKPIVESKEVTSDTDYSTKLTETIKEDYEGSDSLDVFESADVNVKLKKITVETKINNDGLDYQDRVATAEKFTKIALNMYYMYFEEEFEVTSVQVNTSDGKSIGYQYNDPRLD